MHPRDTIILRMMMNFFVNARWICAGNMKLGVRTPKTKQTFTKGTIDPGIGRFYFIDLFNSKSDSTQSAVLILIIAYHQDF